MLRIDPINHNRYNHTTFKKSKPPTDKVKDNESNAKKLLVGTATLALMGITAYTIIRAKKPSSTEKTKDITSILNEEMKQFPKDIDYRKQIAKALNLEESKLANLRSIIGMEEYANIVKEFSSSSKHYTPGTSLLTDIQDNYILSGKADKTFRATMHMHTTHSDGKITVQELLDQAAKYADEVAEALKNQPEAKAKHAPFTLAITDHDTIDGCKEAAKIISENPDKFKNLRVIFGCEVTVENTLLGTEELKKPVSNHIVVNCINPFDKDISSFFEPKKALRAKRGEEVFEECLNRIKELKPELAEKLSYKDACEFDKPIKTGVISPRWGIKMYFTNRFKSEKLEKQEAENLIKEVDKISEKLSPKMEKNESEIDFLELVELFKNKDGYFTWAHPALTAIGDSLKKPENSLKSMEKLFKLFKEKGGEKALATEIHYPYFGDLANSKEWLNLMEKGAKDNGLYKTGGLDTHGKSIFYSKIDGK